jgi:hypothetical protein
MPIMLGAIQGRVKFPLCGIPHEIAISGSCEIQEATVKAGWKNAKSFLK